MLYIHNVIKEDDREPKSRASLVERKKRVGRVREV